MPSDGLSDPQMLEVGSCRPACSVPTSGPILNLLSTESDFVHLMPGRAGMQAPQWADV